MSFSWIGRHAGLVLFVLGLIEGILQMFQPGFGFGPGFEMVAIARNLAEHGTFGNPFPPVITGPTAVVPPLYPAYLALLLKLFGFSPAFALIADFANVLVNASIAALMPRLAMVFFGDAAAGMFGGLLWLLAARLMPQWDVSYTVLGTMLFAILAATVGRRHAAPWAVVAGIAAALLSLMNPATLLVSIPCVAFFLWTRRVPLRQASGYAAILLVTIALCELPWMWRNYRIWHAPVLRTNFGMTIYSSNNSCAESSLARNTENGCYLSTHPVASEREARLLGTLGEVQYDRLRTNDAINWIRSSPRRFGRLTLARIFEFWFPETTGLNLYGFWLATLLSIPGVILMARRREPATWFLLVVWLVYPLLYYIAVSCDRYRYPILWTSLLPAGYFVAAALPQSIRYTPSKSAK